MQDKVALACELERLAVGSPSVSGVKSVSWADAAGESSIVSSTGIESYSRRTSRFLSGYFFGITDGGRPPPRPPTNDDGARGARGDPGAGRKGRLTRGSVCAHYARCGRYG
ncbi:hypothetical protein [Streptomyces sp. NPDC059970]|uniref:hypothetical protein n=1 Tax=Streptomyces sp. NPDC059970 TaxID=3347019 RepID=UPI0036BCD29B